MAFHISIIIENQSRFKFSAIASATGRPPGSLGRCDHRTISERLPPNLQYSLADASGLLEPGVRFNDSMLGLSD
jgi:hypothetical protein